MSPCGGCNRRDVTSRRFAERRALVAVVPKVRLLTPGDVRGLAGRLAVRPSKRLGQNFVIEAGTVRRIAALAGLQPGDVVLEVGPGLGSLTLALLEALPPAEETVMSPAEETVMSPAEEASLPAAATNSRGAGRV